MVREPDSSTLSPALSGTDSASNDAASVALDWLGTEQARRVTARYLRRSALPSTDDLIEDVLADIGVGILERRARGQFDPENPEAYATTMLRNRITKLNRSQESNVELDEIADAMEPDPVYEFMSDDVRVLIETRRLRPIVTSAMLSYLIFLMFPDAVPVDAPQPASGARPDQARVWPALWMAGERELFTEPSSGALRRRRARRIGEVLKHMGEVLEQVKAGQHRAAKYSAGRRSAEKRTVESGNDDG